MAQHYGIKGFPEERVAFLDSMLRDYGLNRTQNGTDKKWGESMPSADGPVFYNVTYFGDRDDVNIGIQSSPDITINRLARELTLSILEMADSQVMYDGVCKPYPESFVEELKNLK